MKRRTAATALLLPGLVSAVVACVRIVSAYRILDAVDIRTVNTAYEDGPPTERPDAETTRTKRAS